MAPLKNVLLVCFLFFAAHAGIAQSIQVKGIIKDIITNEVLSHVTVSTENQEHTTISNDEGAFAFTCPADTRKIILSSIGYNDFAFSLTDLPKDGIFFLEEKSIELEEIIVINIPVHEFIDKLIKTSYDKLNAPFLLSTYYREFVRVNDQYTKFSDALIDYNVEKKKKEVESQVVVKQSRAVKLDVENAEEIDMTSPLDLRKAVSRDCNFSVLKKVFTKKESKKYSFVLKSQAGRDGQVTEAIYFEPLETVEEPLYEGSIVYDPQKNLILSIDLHMANSHKKYSKLRNFLIVKARLDDIAYKSLFKITNDSYMLSYSMVGGNVYLKNKKKYDDNIIFKSDLIVTNFSKDLSSFNKKEKYTDKGLYQRGTKFTDKFWLNNNSILLTAEEEEIIKSISN